MKAATPAHQSYCQLLDATIEYIRELKRQGVKSLPLEPTALKELNQAAMNIPAQPRKSSIPRATHRDSAPPAVPPEVGPGEQSKAIAISGLRERALVCSRCPNLVRSRRNVVFGVGSIEAKLMFVGEAPGADEDLQGEPFVGAAGQLLTRIIKAMAMSRETVYIANVLKCRPDTPGQSSGNRKPTPEEMRTCLPYLLEQIKLIQPQVLVALGATAMEGLFGKQVAISKARGHWHDFHGVPVMPTYHPSYLLRNQSLGRKREVWEDMLAVLERLNLPITEKQRAFFTNT
jgi:uracil-DNA glycosylase